MGIVGFLSGLFDNPEKCQIGQKGGWLESEFRDAIEEVAQMVYPKVRWSSNYRKKLRPAVEHTLEYADGLVKEIPGPVDFSLGSWGDDPLSRVLFATVEEHRDFFQNNAELQQVFQTPGVEHCYALLTMTKEEKNVFGVELEGGIIKRDVAQVAVHFGEHRVVAPIPSEEACRKALALRALSLLATRSLEEMLSIISWKEKLQEQKEILEIQLKVRQAREKGIASLMSGVQTGDPQLAEAKAVAAEIDQKISTINEQFDDPEDYLKHVTTILFNPQDTLTAEPLRMRLSDMGIKLPESSSARGADVHLTELSLKDGPKRTALFIRYMKE
jgi:hypothetical protein